MKMRFLKLKYVFSMIGSKAYIGCLWFLKGIIPTLKLKYIQERRRYLIERAMSTSEGQQALASAMVEPIRRALNYQSIGRTLLMIDELPQGAYTSSLNQVITQVQPMTAPTGLIFYVNMDKISDEQENALCDYLVWYADFKTNKQLDELRRNVRNSISGLKIGG